jgi:hypothetical protein
MLSRSTTSLVGSMVSFGRRTNRDTRFTGDWGEFVTQVLNLFRV